MLFRLLISFLLLGSLAFIVNKSTNISDLWQLLINFPKQDMIVFFFMSAAISALKAWRFLLLLRSCEIKIDFWDTFKTYIAGQATSPLPGGEAMRGVLIKAETGTRFIKLSGPIMSQVLLELFSAAFLALIGSLYFEIFRVPVAIMMIILIVIIIVIINRQVLETIEGTFKRWKKVEAFLKKLAISQVGVRENLFDQDKTLLKAFLLSLLAHTLGGFLLYLIAQSFEVHLPLIKSIFVYATTILIQGLSIVPGGIGFTEGGMTGILLLSQIEFAKVIAIVLVFRFVTLIFNMVLGAVFLLAFYSKHLFRKK